MLLLNPTREYTMKYELQGNESHYCFWTYSICIPIATVLIYKSNHKYTNESVTISQQELAVEREPVLMG